MIKMEEVKSRFITAAEIMEVCQVGRSKAYQIINKLNKELEAKGKIVIAGKVNRKFFESKINP